LRGGKRKEEKQSPYSGIERQLLNTFFSGIYFSAKEFVELGKELNLDLPVKGRELVLKKIIAEVSKKGEIPLFVEKLSAMIDRRKGEYEALLQNYPESRDSLFPLIQKTVSTKKLLHTVSRNPYM
jgi:hypothetical protein